MKKSIIPTAYIIIKTFSSDEFNYCDFAIVQITEEWLQLIRQRLQNIQTLISDNSLSHLVYWNAPCDFFDDSKNHSTAAEIIGDLEDWCYLELSKEEFEKLTPPEMALDFYQTVLDRYGNVSFKCSGKHSSTEFSTSEIKLTEIL
jgi:hypothetical protein